MTGLAFANQRTEMLRPHNRLPANFIGRERLGELEEENRQLRHLMLEIDRAPIPQGFAPLQWQLLCALRRRNAVSYNVWVALRSLESGPDADHNNILKTTMCRLRHKLKDTGVEIWTMWGRGYVLDEANKQRLDAIYGPLQ